MIRRACVVAVAALMMLDTYPVMAQDDASLILEDEPQVRIRMRPRDEPRRPRVNEEDEERQQVAPTPKPEEVIVAIVNSKSLTRAELNLRVSSQYEKLRDQVQQEVGGVIGNLSATPVPTPSLTKARRASARNEDDSVLDEQREAIEKAMHLEEEVALQEWVEHSLLAAEARRQKLIVSEDEFRSRLQEAEAQNELSMEIVDQVLKNAQMSRTEYERHVYDALLIEKLLNHFVDLNYSEEYLRAAYDSNPLVFYEPEKFLLAHFTVAMDGTESESRVRDLRKKAEDVRDRLRAGEEPKELFQQPEYKDLENGIAGGVPGYFSFQEGMLPKIVEIEGRKLKPGQTSGILTNQVRDQGKVVPVSFHVIKIMDRMPETGRTFESALPAIRRTMLEVAREKLMARIVAAKTHRVITSLSGVKAEKIPTPEQVIQLEANAQPINLRLPQS